MRPLGFALALASMLLSALLPGGWMPGANAASPLVICTGHGPVQLAPQQRHQHEPRQHGDGACPFAGGAYCSPPVVFTETAAPAAIWFRAMQAVSAQRAPYQALRGPHSPRAPPFPA